MTGRHKAAPIIFGLGIAFMIFAMLMSKWGIPQLTGYFVLIAILMGIASKLSAGKIADGFVEGARQLLSPRCSSPMAVVTMPIMTPAG